MTEEGAVLDERFSLSVLFDWYGPLLSDRQRDCYDLYYNEDLSLAEIAELKGISRQGVWDAIHHAEDNLRDYERKTGLIARIRELESELESVKDGI